MTESPRREGSEPTQPLGGGYPVDYPDPAYANQPYNPAYPAVPNAGPTPGTNPTQQLPPYAPYGYDANTSSQYGAGYQPPGSPPPPPEPDDDGPRPWLWILAGVAVLVVVGLVIALVIANSSRQETVVAPQPVTPEPSPTRTTTAPPTTSRSPRPVPVPPSTSPITPTTPGATETVTYEVAGDGRAINITYVDSGNMLQTEFNVILPWSKQVELPEPATQTASVSVINFGPEVTCTVSVNGVETQHQTGTGLTVCVGEGGPPR